MKPIDKVVAEIERIEHETNYEPFTDEVLGKRCVCRSLLSFIDTLEVKEVDSNDAFIEKVESFLNKKDDRDSYTIGYIKRHLKEIIKEVGL